MKKTTSALLLSFWTIAFIVAPVSAQTWQTTTIAGTGVTGYSGDNGPATHARIANPYGIVRGPDDALYVCEVDSHVIRRIARDGTISTAVGTGTRGYSGDDGPALKAQLNEPYEVRFDRQGNMLFVEMKNHLVRRVDAKTKVITTMAGTGRPGFSGDGGAATRAQLNQPHSIQLDASDNLYICDIANHRIRKVDAKTGVISTFAGTGGRGLTPDGAKAAWVRHIHGPSASPTVSLAPDGKVMFGAGNMHVFDCLLYTSDAADE